MSSGVDRVSGSLDFEESNPELSPAGVTRMFRRAGQLYVSIDGAPISLVEPLDPWPGQQRAFLRGILPTLTGFEYQRAGFYGLGAAIAGMTPNDGTIEGGGESAPVAGTAHVYSASIIQSAKTAAFGLVCRVKMPTPVAAKVNRWGLLTAGGTARITFGTDQSVSATLFFKQVEGTSNATTIAATAAFNDLAIVGDGTNITFYVNGVSGGTIACSALTANEALHFFISNTDVKTTIWTKLLVGYIAP